MSVYDSEFIYNDAAKAANQNGAAIVVGYTASDWGWGNSVEVVNSRFTGNLAQMGPAVRGRMVVLLRPV